MHASASAIPIRHPESGGAIRPPLKWAGGKRWQLPHLLPIWHQHRGRRLVEPFCGGLAVALGLLPTRALLNDVNPHLINFYGHLKAGLLVDQVFVNRKPPYYRNRKRFNNLLRNGQQGSPEAALLFYYLNRTGYNGLCRFNQDGEFNVPFGRYKTISYRQDFDNYRDVFARWDFSNQHFNALTLQADDFVYADPPYDVPFTQYSKGGFSWADQVSAAAWLASHNGPVVLSNQATSRIMDLYRDLGFQTITLHAPRRISCTGDRTPALEVLAFRNI